MGAIISPPLRLDSESEYRLVSYSSTTAGLVLEALTANRLKDIPVLHRVATLVHTGGRAGETATVSTGGGYLYGLYTSAPGSTKRGQTYAQAQVGLHGKFITLAKGYVHETHGLFPGQWEDSVSGRGYLHWVQEADDVAGNVADTTTLAITNLRRIVRAIIVKYHQTGGSAITLTITLRDMATAAGPTNWSIASDTWVSPTLTLGANEEGLIHVDQHGFVATNDAGTLAYADNTTAPNPFPLDVQDGDTVDIIVAAGSGASGDDYDVWVQYEDWVEV